MGVAKGQMMASGLILLGLMLTTFAFTSFDSTDSEGELDVYTNVEKSVPNQVKTISESYSGREFVENFQSISYNYRDRISATGSTVSYTVLAGKRDGRSFNIYTGNFGSDFQNIEIEVNNQTKGFSLDSDGINGNSFDVSDGYNVSVNAEDFDYSFEVFDNSFVLVHYRYSGNGDIRQDTYIG
jgi:hypothetical protein